ncbi:acetate--CoA ligase family protein [Pleurocapsales cyanobacterium LEGE 10410]|nr:acetate--CoA ligase family protein [Pleurocapsales cyanobacterium LEGE 10410]
MELLEYQAKELFRMVGIPILPSQTIKDSRKIKELQIPYPVVLKSQVRSGGRGKAGGVRFVANTIDAIAAARTIFNLSILGEYPEVILAEAHYNTEREFFLAIVLDYNLQCPVLLGSAFGGMNVDSLLTNLQQVVVDEEFSLFYARRLAAHMGLSGKLICSVSEIIAKMYRLFRDKDLDLIEINPLGVNNKGELMALDGKITLNDDALARQPVLEALSFTKQQKQLNDRILTGKILERVRWRWLDWHSRAGKVAIICNSFDSALLTWDLFKQNRVTPAGAVLLETDFSEPDILESYRDNLLDVLTQLETVKGLKTILINVWDTQAIGREIVETVSSYCQQGTSSILASKEESVSTKVRANEPDLVNKQKSSDSTTIARPRFVLRLLADEHPEALPMSETIYLFDGLEAAVQKAIAIVKSN